MGIIVDAGGMWTGIVTIEDLIEQMIGEIDDESAFGRGGAPVSLADALSPARIMLELHASSMIEAIEKILHGKTDRERVRPDALRNAKTPEELIETIRAGEQVLPS